MATSCLIRIFFQEEAEKLGSGETAYSKAKGKAGATSASGPESLPVGKAVHFDRSLDHLVTPGTKKKSPVVDMFSKALADWDVEKTALVKTSTERKQLLSTDMSNQRETQLEQELLHLWESLSRSLRKRQLKLKLLNGIHWLNSKSNSPTVSPMENLLTRSHL